LSLLYQENVSKRLGQTFAVSRRCIAFIPPNTGLIDSLSAAENISFSCGSPPSL
jgi:ABC-type lipoprotein export system ATPase subunit